MRHSTSQPQTSRTTVLASATPSRFQDARPAGRSRSADTPLSGSHSLSLSLTFHTMPSTLRQSRTQTSCCSGFRQRPDSRNRVEQPGRRLRLACCFLYICPASYGTYYIIYTIGNLAKMQNSSSATVQTPAMHLNYSTICGAATCHELVKRKKSGLEVVNPDKFVRINSGKQDLKQKGQQL